MLLKFKHTLTEVNVKFPFFTHMDKEKFRCYSSPTSYVAVDKKACAIKYYKCPEYSLQVDINQGWKVSDIEEFKDAVTSVIEDTENTLNELESLFTAKDSIDDEPNEYEGEIR